MPSAMLSAEGIISFVPHNNTPQYVRYDPMLQVRKLRHDRHCSLFLQNQESTQTVCLFPEPKPQVQLCDSHRERCLFSVSLGLLVSGTWKSRCFSDRAVR